MHSHVLRRKSGKKTKLSMDDSCHRYIIGSGLFHQIEKGTIPRSQNKHPCRQADQQEQGSQLTVLLSLPSAQTFPAVLFLLLSPPLVALETIAIRLKAFIPLWVSYIMFNLSKVKNALSNSTLLCRLDSIDRRSQIVPHCQNVYETIFFALIPVFAWNN